MNKNLIFVIIFMLGSLFLDAQSGYKIKVRVKNLKDTTCLLANYYGNKQYIQDTARFDATGNLVFEGKEKLPGGIYIVYCPSVVVNSKIFEIILTENQVFSVETDTADFIKNMKVKGSDETKFWYDYLLFIGEKEKQVTPLRDMLKQHEKNADSAKLIREKMKVIDEEVIAFKKDFMKKHPNSFVGKLFKAMEEVTPTEDMKKAAQDSLFEYKYFKAHFFDNMDLSDSTFLRTPLFHKKIDYYYSKLTSPHPDSLIVACDYLIGKTGKNKEMFKYMVWYSLNTYGASQIMGYDKIYVHLGDKYYRTGLATWMDTASLRKMIERIDATKPLLIGKKAPDMVMQDSLDRFINLYSLRNDYVIVIFWDDDCGHCKTEMPKIRDFYAKYKKDRKVNLEVFAVCTESEKDKWKKYIRDQKYEWINVVDPYGERRKYDIQSTPIIYVLDKDKKILAKKLGADQLGDFMEHLLKNPKP